MRIDEKKQKIKTLRKMNKRSSDLGSTRYLMDWVPVDEPRFIGWETTVGLSEPALRRSDAQVLLNVLAITRVDRPLFTRELSIVKLIRRNGKRYMKISADWREHCRRISRDRYWYSNFLPGSIQDYHDRFITPQQFDKLDERHRKYLEKKETYYPPTAWHNGITEVKYRVGGAFPLHELRVKLTKAYSTHRGIPRSEEIRESEFIHDKLMEEHYWCAKYCTVSNRRSKPAYRKMEHRQFRGGWNQATRMMSKLMESKDDFETVEEFERRTKKEPDRLWW